ncbi:hypothetical protein CONPUDRAFT_166674 [Coniophora puteana RWD-64-598 SS2]|uniref:Uncharacterized protein n=1 Tax=Coniophora puteana (strain RWD-64-598) TaxID=741705 RepID=A0A5M3MLH2_CONPW|nr:uncharacterized protein CONPUDRAFT_166674 [Coniophora puteana RWD-64-598 SS2]EIW80082.1 hypothetical protein CONPUDRAFT_166674 [Coniophora puteana RWD-64-598 SS2]
MFTSTDSLHSYLSQVGDVDIMADFVITFILVLAFIIVSLDGDVKRLASDEDDGFIPPFPGSTTAFFSFLSQDIICESRIPQLVNTAACQPYILGSSPSIPSLTHPPIPQVVSIPVRSNMVNEDCSDANTIPAIMVTPSETLGFAPTTILESPSSRSTTPSSDRSSISRIPRLVMRSFAQDEVVTSTPCGLGSGARRAKGSVVNTTRSTRSPTPSSTRIHTPSPVPSRSPSLARSRTPSPTPSRGCPPTWDPLNGRYSPCGRCNHRHSRSVSPGPRKQHLSLRSRSVSPNPRSSSANSSGSTGGSETLVHSDVNDSKDASTSSTILTDEELIPGFAEIVDKRASQNVEKILSKRASSAAPSSAPASVAIIEQDLSATSSPSTPTEDGLYFKDINLMSMESIIAERDFILGCLASPRSVDSIFSSDDESDIGSEESQEGPDTGEDDEPAATQLIASDDSPIEITNDYHLLPLILNIVTTRKEVIQHRHDALAELEICARKAEEVRSERDSLESTCKGSGHSDFVGLAGSADAYRSMGAMLSRAVSPAPAGIPDFISLTTILKAELANLNRQSVHWKITATQSSKRHSFLEIELAALTHEVQRLSVEREQAQLDVTISSPSSSRSASPPPLPQSTSSSITSIVEPSSTELSSTMSTSPIQSPTAVIPSLETSSPNDPNSSVLTATIPSSSTLSLRTPYCSELSSPPNPSSPVPQVTIDDVTSIPSLATDHIMLEAAFALHLPALPQTTMTSLVTSTMLSPPVVGSPRDGADNPPQSLVSMASGDSYTYDRYRERLEHGTITLRGIDVYEPRRRDRVWKKVKKTFKSKSKRKDEHEKYGHFPEGWRLEVLRERPKKKTWKKVMTMGCSC